MRKRNDSIDVNADYGANFAELVDDDSLDPVGHIDPVGPLADDDSLDPVGEFVDSLIPDSDLPSEDKAREYVDTEQFGK